MALERYGENYGVDKGTTSDAIAVYSPLLRKPVLLSNWDGEFTIPSDVDLRNPPEKSLYGKAAKYSKEVHRTISSAKTSVPKERDVTKEGVWFDVKQAISISASLNRAEFEEASGVKIEKGVLTYPADWNEANQEFYKKAVSREIRRGRKDFEVRAMLPEPVAAGFSYKRIGEKPETILVYDSGGGTTDLALMTMGEGHITVHAVHGITYAGDDWTELILSFLKEKLEMEGISYAQDLKLLKELRQESEKIKVEMPEKFYMNKKANGELEFEKYGKRDVQVFSNVSRKYVSFAFTTVDYMRIYEVFKKEMKKVRDEFTEKIKGFKVDTVLLVGGTCSNPVFQQTLKNVYSKDFYQDVKVIAHKEKVAVAIGAAYYAHWVFDEKQKIVIQNNAVIEGVPEEVIPEIVMECSESIGIKGRSADGRYRIGNVILKGNAFPCRRRILCGAKADRDTGTADLEVYLNYSKEYRVEMSEARRYVGVIKLDLSEFQLGVDDVLLVEIELRMPRYGVIELEVFHYGRKLQKAVLEFE